MATVLVIDDDVPTLFLLNKILINECKELLLHNNAASGLKLIYEKQPDLILLDVFINNENGIEVCKQLKADVKTRHIPVIFLSCATSSTDKVNGFSAGGVDYISKPFDINEVLARAESCLVTHKKIQQILPATQEKIAKTLQHYPFSKRELEILDLYISGYKRCDIAEKTSVSENTVKWYLKQIFQKLCVDNRAGLIEKMRALEI